MRPRKVGHPSPAASKRDTSFSTQAATGQLLGLPSPSALAMRPASRRHRSAQAFMGYSDHDTDEMLDKAREALSVTPKAPSTAKTTKKQKR